MTHRGGSIRIRLQNFSPSKDYIQEIMAGGTPSLSRQGLSSLATVMLNYGAGAYGDAAIAGMSVVNRFTMILLAAVIGFGQGFQPFCGFCYGARLYERVKDGFWYAVRVSTLFLLVCSVVGWIFSDHIIVLFRRDPAVVAVGTVALKWQLASLPLTGLIILGNMFTQPIRKTIRANILAAARSGLFFIPLMMILPNTFGLMGVEMCQTVSDVLAFSLTLPILHSAFREMR